MRQVRADGTTRRAVAPCREGAEGGARQGKDAAMLPVDGVSWSVHVQSDSGEVLWQHEPDRALPGASLGKLVLLAEVAERLAKDGVASNLELRRTDDDTVRDSGLWQSMTIDALPAADLALLVGAVSDNLATNVLLRWVGRDAVAERGRRLGLERTALHDRVRDHRGPGDPATLSTVTARELVHIIRVLDGVEPGLSPEAATLLRDWLAAGCDLSMAAAAFDLDPLAHRDVDRGLLLVNKTGTDDGVRGEAGRLRSRTTGAVAYAAVASWDASGPDRRHEVLQAMRAIGERVMAAVVSAD